MGCGFLDGVEDRIDRPIAACGFPNRLAIDGEIDLGRLRAFGAGHDAQARNLDGVIAVRDLVVDQSDDVLIEHVALAVAQFLETLERVVQRIVSKRVAQFFELLLECVTARELAHHQARRALAHIFRTHDFVRLGVLQHAVLVDAALVTEGVLADDGLVELHREARHARYGLADAHQLRAVDIGLIGQIGAAHAERHDDLFERCIAGALAETIDRAFDLARAALHGCDRVGDSEAKIVVTVRREDRLISARHAFDQIAEEVAIFVGE